MDALPTPLFKEARMLVFDNVRLFEISRVAVGRASEYFVDGGAILSWLYCLGEGGGEDALTIITTWEKSPPQATIPIWPKSGDPIPGYHPRLA